MLHYYRCENCLSTITYPERDLNAVCVCGGALEYLGIVTEDNRVVETYEIPVCDGRCTHAKGIFCKCQCGGKNHGTELLVTIHHDNGIATITPADAKAFVFLAEYRRLTIAAETQLREKFGTALDDYLASRWISDKSLWLEIRLAWTKFCKVSSLHSRTGRLSALLSLTVKSF